MSQDETQQSGAIVERKLRSMSGLFSERLNDFIQAGGLGRYGEMSSADYARAGAHVDLERSNFEWVEGLCSELDLFQGDLLIIARLHILGRPEMTACSQVRTGMKALVLKMHENWKLPEDALVGIMKGLVEDVECQLLGSDKVTGVLLNDSDCEENGDEPVCEADSTVEPGDGEIQSIFSHVFNLDQSEVSIEDPESNAPITAAEIREAISGIDAIMADPKPTFKVEDVVLMGAWASRIELRGIEQGDREWVVSFYEFAVLLRDIGIDLGIGESESPDGRGPQKSIGWVTEAEIREAVPRIDKLMQSFDVASAHAIVPVDSEEQTKIGSLIAVILMRGINPDDAEFVAKFQDFAEKLNAQLEGEEPS